MNDSMTTLLLILYISLLISLVMVIAAKPRRIRTSHFELRRRSESGDSEAEQLLQRELVLHDILSLQQVMTSLLTVALHSVGVALFGLGIGVVIAFLVSLEIGAVARTGVVARFTNRIYQRVEPKLLGWIERYPYLFTAIRSVSPITHDVRQLESREELLYLVDQAGDLLSDDERHVIANSLGFSSRAVSTIMTPRAVIDSVPKKELLGPLVLDDLHKTGHSRFPVIDEDLDHIVGMLHIQDLLTLDGGKRTTTAEKAMEARVYYIHQDQTLRQALAGFIRTHHHLFIVINQYRETVGVLTLEDVIEALLGRKIIDEFDSHQDLRMVAARNPKHNNTPAHHVEV